MLYQRIYCSSFNPRSREGATPKPLKQKGLSDVSIHAPVKERLPFTGVKDKNGEVSIHAPVKERPAPNCQPTKAADCFNPRSREGATAFMFCKETAGHVSIHAPVKERRRTVSHLGSYMCVSIHAPVKERPSQKVQISATCLFQSTLP